MAVFRRSAAAAAAVDAAAVEPVADLSHVRLICMGFGILPDAKSLTGEGRGMDTPGGKGKEQRAPLATQESGRVACW